jgi:hypothetical protein
MTTATDLLGLGLPPELARRLGNTPLSVNAAGTTYATAYVPDPLMGNLFSVTAADASHVGVALPTNAELGTILIWNNVSSQAVTVFTQNGASGTINGTAGNTGISLIQNKTIFTIKFSQTAWFSILTA